LSSFAPRWVKAARARTASTRLIVKAEGEDSGSQARNPVPTLQENDGLQDGIILAGYTLKKQKVRI